MCKFKVKEIVKVAKNYNAAYNEVKGSNNYKNILPFEIGGGCLLAGLIYKNVFLIILAVLILFKGFYTYIQPLLYEHTILQKVIRISFLCCVPFVVFFNGVALCEVYFTETTNNLSMVLLAFSYICTTLVVGSLTTRDAINHIRRINEEKSYIFYLLLEFFQIINFFAVLYSLILVFDHNGIVGMDTSNAYTIYIDMVYFSTVTFTTLGYGDIVPINPFAKVTVILEVFLFVIVISLIVVNLTRTNQVKEETSVKVDTDEKKQEITASID